MFLSLLNRFFICLCWCLSVCDPRDLSGQVRGKRSCVARLTVFVCVLGLGFSGPAKAREDSGQLGTTIRSRTIDGGTSNDRSGDKGRTVTNEASADEAAREAFFESKIRPILATHCYECHSSVRGSSEGGLQLDSRDGILSGGERGMAIVAGRPEKSRLLDAIRHQAEDLHMPPRGPRLSDAVISRFEKWIREGAFIPLAPPAEYSGDGKTARVAGKHWAYGPVQPQAPPKVAVDWCRNRIDGFIAAGHQKHGLRASADASMPTLLRRLHFDLVGLPPSPQDIQRFAASVKATGIEAALRAKVDALLQSPHFGERWGRHWLDVVRYAESSGKEANITFPYAWRYRDYVIDAINQDLPLDQFIHEQIAGDLLPFDDAEDRTRLLIATGFLALGPKNLDEANARQFSADLVDEQIDSVTRVFMASSVACARCHDHKFDPFTMRDYYGLAGIFSSTRTFFGTAVSPANRVGGDPLVLPVLNSTQILHRGITAKKLRELKSQRAMLEKERREKGKSLTLRDALRILWRMGAIEGQLEKVDERGRPLPLAMGVLDHNSIGDAPLLLRGDVRKVAHPVPRAFPGAISLGDHAKMPSIPADQSGRLQLAQWLTNPLNPLTSRVYVNRVWSHLMGSGLVDTVDDFGITGQAPSHGRLLDDLAGRFMHSGWSTKKLVREIVLSRTYRQRSTYDAKAYFRDPENRFLWRMSKRRIEAEAMRDAMLMVSGLLDRRRPAGSLVGRVVGDRPVSLVGLDRRLPRDLDGAVHRSVYLPAMRDRLPDLFDVFDFPDPSLVTGKRQETNVPTQALYLMNSDFVYRCAEAFAESLGQTTEGNNEFIHQAFLRCYGREPTGEEFSRVQKFLSRESYDPHEARVDCCHSLLSIVEFRVLD